MAGAKESQALQLLPVVEQAVNRIGNWEKFSPGVYGSFAGIGGTMMTGSMEAGAVLATVVTLLRNPAFKSKLAFAMHKAGTRTKSPVGFGQAMRLIESRADRLARAEAALNISLSGQSPRQQSHEQAR